MTRNEILKSISSMPALAKKINEEQGINFTRCKTSVLEEYLVFAAPDYGHKNTATNAFESAALSFLVTLEQKGVLDDLLAKIK